MVLAIGFMYLACLALVPLVGYAVWQLAEGDRLMLERERAEAATEPTSLTDVRDATRAQSLTPVYETPQSA